MKKYWKVALFALPLVLLLAVACEKESSEPVYRAPYEKELRFNHYDTDSIEMPIVQKFARDTACKHVYLTLTDNNSFTNQTTNMITNVRNYLDARIQLAPEKISGRGDFNFYPGTASIADSLWFVEQGWTVNQRRYNR
ncbi:hypothetical protein HDR62_03345 [bacterium]|nr:hypothetical protein [bacterium]